MTIITRYFLEIEYDGSLFCGFQRQSNTHKTIQKKLEDAFTLLCQQEVSVVCAGRTDAGVHAIGQVIHVDLNKHWDPKRLQSGLNFYLRQQPIAVINAYICKLHARFDALERFYEYRILNRYGPSPLLRNRVWHVPSLLDLDLMQQGCLRLIGLHDFNAFRSIDCQAKNPKRQLNTATCVSYEPSLIVLNFSAQAFLHNQVRIMVGTLVKIGLRKMPLAQIDQAFESGDRQLAGPTAPPDGLFFMRVRYPINQ